jgi:hypothetical protein
LTWVPRPIVRCPGTNLPIGPVGWTGCATGHMAAGVAVSKRIPQNPGVTIERLRIHRLRHQRIGGKPAGQRGTLILTTPFGLSSWEGAPSWE